MGRPGGGGGGHHGGSSHSGRGGSSHSHSSRSSYRSSGSSHRSSGGGFGGGYRGPAYGPGPMGPGPMGPPPRRHYYGGSRYYSGGGGSGCLVTVTSLIIIVMIFMLFVNMSGRSYFNMISGNKVLSSNTIDENVVYDQAQKFYSENFRDENHALLYYAYLEDNETDCAYLVIGDEAIKIFDDDMQDKFWDVYDGYYYGDATEAEWLSYTFRDMGVVISKDRGTIANDVSFDQSCYDDRLDWIGRAGKDTLIAGLHDFYNQTGIQPFIVLENYEDMPGVVISTGNNSTSLKTFFVCVAGVIIVVILFKWWKKAQARKKEEADRTERMLNVPLDKFGDTTDKEMNDLIDKYNDK